MPDYKKLDENELGNVAGGGTESMQEVSTYAYNLFLEVVKKGGTISDLNDALKSVLDKIEYYSTKAGKIMDFEKPIIESQVYGFYNTFFLMLNK